MRKQPAPTEKARQPVNEKARRPSDDRARHTDDCARQTVDHVGRGDVQQGYQPTLTPDNAPLRELSVGRIRLDRKGVARYSGETGDREVLLHILVGQCTIETSGRWGRRTFKQLGERVDVFSGLPTSLVLGPRTAYIVISVTRTVDIAVASLPVGRAGPSIPTVIRPQDVQVHTIGEDHYQRTVREVIGGEGPAQRLRAGETINPTGRWSSWPHHDFDANAKLAPEFEEVFLYFTKPRSGWGLQRRQGLYSGLQQVDDVIVVRNGDAAILPLGEHPVVAGVDSQVLYIWFYMSPIPKTYSKWADDLGGYA